MTPSLGGPGPRRGAGFTLVELMTVLVILGMLGVVAMARMGRRSRADATQGLSRQIYTRLIQARFTAVSSGARVQVRLVPGVTPAVLQVQPSLVPGMSPGSPFGPVTDQVPGSIDARLIAVAPTVDAGGPLPAPTTAAEVRLIFYPDGRAQIDGNPPHPGTTIYVADDLLGHPHRLTVLGRTGFARLLDN